MWFLKRYIDWRTLSMKTRDYSLREVCQSIFIKDSVAKGIVFNTTECLYELVWEIFSKMMVIFYSFVVWVKGRILIWSPRPSRYFSPLKFKKCGQHSFDSYSFHKYLLRASYTRHCSRAGNREQKSSIYKMFYFL